MLSGVSLSVLFALGSETRSLILKWTVQHAGCLTLVFIKMHKLWGGCKRDVCKPCNVHMDLFGLTCPFVTVNKQRSNVSPRVDTQDKGPRSFEDGGVCETLWRALGPAEVLGTVILNGKCRKEKNRPAEVEFSCCRGASV
jgi:hypothetical protein